MIEIKNCNFVRFFLVVLILCLSAVACTQGTQSNKQTNQKARKVPYEYREFSFDFNNLGSDSVGGELKVLAHFIDCGAVANTGSHIGSGESDRRKDCTPKALLKSPGDFDWYKQSELGAGTKIPKKRYKLKVPFPEFDVDAQAWRCYFTMQHDNTWVGRYEGVKSKKLNAENNLAGLSKEGKQQSWIYFQFLNLSDKEIYFDPPKTKIVTGSSEALLFLPNVPADGQLHSIAAHSHKGSIYRPQAGSKLVVDWGVAGTPPQRHEFDLPDFSNKKMNWYCYFTLDKNGSWSTDFEGVVE